MVNLMHRNGKLLFCQLDVSASGRVLSLLLSCLMSNISVLVSSRAGAVKQAQQTGGISVFIVVDVVSMTGLPTLKSITRKTRDTLLRTMLAGKIGQAALVPSALLVALAVRTFVMAKTHFQRTRLTFEE